MFFLYFLFFIAAYCSQSLKCSFGFGTIPSIFEKMLSFHIKVRTLIWTLNDAGKTGCPVSTYHRG